MVLGSPVHGVVVTPRGAKQVGAYLIVEQVETGPGSEAVLVGTLRQWGCQALPPERDRQEGDRNTGKGSESGFDLSDVVEEGARQHRPGRPAGASLGECGLYFLRDCYRMTPIGP